jgi:UDP-glucose 4-epimerase
LKILIVGGNGFLGARIAQYLYYAGHNISVLCRQDKNPAFSQPGVKNIFVDFLNQEELSKACNNFEVILYAAGISARDSITDPEKAFLINGSVVNSMINAGLQNSVNKFIYISTIHVYSEALTGRIDETTPLTNTHPYALSHALGEQFVRAVNRYRSMEACVIRLSNSFGAPVHVSAKCWDLVVNNMCQQAIKTHMIDIKSNVNFTRDYAPLSYVCHAIEKLIHEQKLSDVYNVGAGSTKTLLELAQIIQKRSKTILRLKPKINYNFTQASTEKETLQFRSVENLNLVRYNQNDFENEIDNLLIFCRNNF